MKRFLLTLAFFLTILTRPGLAQDGPALSSLEIALWPEYDRPEVLVIQQGLFSSDTSLPVPVEIRIPARVGQPTAVAYVGEGGQRFNQEHTTQVEGEELVVSFDLPTLGFQLEYYDELPVGLDGQREYTYVYNSPYPLEALDLRFQVPPTAESFALEPPADTVVPESDGLTYHLAQAGSMAQGETKSWTFVYEKSGSQLTASALDQSPQPAPAAASTPGSSDESAVLIFLVAFLALIAVGGGAFWLGRRAQPISQEAPPPVQRRTVRGRGQGTQPQGHTESTAFCHKCGSRVRPDADFCHKCGAGLRKSKA
jgi:hypothetical protein